MVRRAITLTEEQRQELLELRDHDRRPAAVRERGAAILKNADVQSPHHLGILRGG